MTTLVKTYDAPPLNTREILRYAGCREATPEVTALLSSCLGEAEGQLTYTVCYTTLPLSVDKDRCDFGAFAVTSRALADTMRGCDEAVLFAATVGVPLDRLIARYGRIAPSKAVMMQAIGAERIEALCDTFCRDLAQRKGKAATRRFSPGYGDLPLSVQCTVFEILDCTKRAGITLSDRFLMSPSKSVTAFVGLREGMTCACETTCRSCEKRDCTFRGDL